MEYQSSKIGLSHLYTLSKIGLILLIWFFSVSAKAQQRVGDIQIKGVVYGLDNNTFLPLPGALVSIKGENLGTVTDDDGKFVLKASKGNDKEITLEISHVAMLPHTEVIGNQTEVTIYMEPSVTQLDEVIITSSYGTSKLREEVVGSISTVAPEEIATEQPAISFDELLEGQAAGVLVEINPVLGGAATIDIRGQSTLTLLNNNRFISTQPLIIVDGVILSEEITLEGNNFFDFGTGVLSEDLLNPLAKVGIQDIESFSILKDAAAVGFYGADAANGVILITTKAGQKGSFSYSTSMQAGVTTAFNQINRLNGEQYQSVLNQLFTNDGQLNNVEEWDGTDTDWFDLLNRNGSFWRYSASASGSIKDWRVRASLGYQKTNEAQRENTFEKFNSSLNIDYEKSDFNLKLRLSPSLTVKNDPNTLYAYAIQPTRPLFDTEGNYTRIDTYGNPVAVSKQNVSESRTKALLGSLNLSYTFFNKFKISTLIGGDLSDKEQDKWFSGLNGSGIFRDGELGRRLLRDRNTRKWNWHSTLSYVPGFKGLHQMDAIAGIELRGDRVDFDYARGDGFDNFATSQPVSLAEDQDYQSDFSVSTARSFFTQWNYNYNQRYFFLVNFRIDQSSVFGGDNDTAYNGGLGLSWNISSENFLKNNQWIDFLRVRTSYGQTGNSRIGSYTALGLYDIRDTPFAYQSIGQSATLDVDFPPNPNLGWEVNAKFNVGLDLDFLNRFTLTADFFRDNLKDLIVSRDIIAEAGYSSARINGANMYNQGIELSLAANWFPESEFTWRSSFNLTRIRNKVTSLTGLESEFSSASLARAQRVGHPTSTLWGFNFVGIDPANGRELFEVDGEIYDAVTLRNNFDETDWIPLGDTQPDLFGGLNNTFSYKNISLNIIMSYAFGGDILIRRALVDGYNDLDSRNFTVEVFHDAWKQPGDIATLPVIIKRSPIVNNSSKYIYDNSHVKLKSVSLRYRVPVEKMKVPFESLEVGINGSNLHYWFMEASPEGRNGVAELRNPYPEMRTFTLNINTTF
ncbi:MAG: SusC/RagA family TonB-linked outer membrane protein [Bacteroidota bacterium]